MTPTDAIPRDGPRSLVMHGAARHYDLLASLLTLGREGALRARLADLARLAPGEYVVDVGCGTGSLALAAQRRVGPAGRVRGIDASPEMVAQARAKAAKTRHGVAFEVARAEALPLADGSVDVVLGTLILHHLPPVVRASFAREVRRVLRPGGRVLVVDFEAPAGKRGGLLARVHRHGGVPLARIVQLLSDAGLRVVERGSVGAGGLQFALAEARVAEARVAEARVAEARVAEAPAGGRPGAPDAFSTAADAAPAVRSLPPLPWPRWLLPAGLGALMLAHVLVVRLAWSGAALGAVAGAGVLALVGAAAAHLGAAGGVHALLPGHRRRG